MLLNKVCMSRLGANRHLRLVLWSWGPHPVVAVGWVGQAEDKTKIDPIGSMNVWYISLPFPATVSKYTIDGWKMGEACFLSASMRFDDNHAIICSKKWSFNKFDCFDNWKQQSEQPRQTINKQSPNYYKITNHTIPTSTFQRVLFEP